MDDGELFPFSFCFDFLVFEGDEKIMGEWTYPDTGNKLARYNGDFDVTGNLTEKGQRVSAFTAVSVIETIYPVGALYISTLSTNPATLLGFGTWTTFGAGKVLVSLDSGDTDFDVVEETGGAKTVASVGTNANESSHTHTGAAHTHPLSDDGYAFIRMTSTAAAGAIVGRRVTVSSWTDEFETDTADASSSSSSRTTATPLGGATDSTTPGAGGAGSAHTHTFTGTASSVVQPYTVVYMFKRTA